MNNEKNKIKILLIDDDEMMRIYFRDIFWVHGGKNNYDIEIASSLDEGRKMLDDPDTKPDTIFLDLMLPLKGEKNSPDELLNRTMSFIKEVKDNNSFSCIKIIIYSSQKDKKIEEEVRKLGVDGFLIKGELMPKEIIDFTDKIHECNN